MREYRKVSKGVIFAIVIAVIVIGVSLISLFSLGKEEPESGGKQLAGSVNYLEESNSIEEASTSSDKTVNEVKENKIALNTENFVNSQNTTTNQKQTNTTSKKTNTTTSASKQATKKEEKKEIKFEKPVEGEIIKEFAKDNLVFSNTLNEWTTHVGIDIKAAKTTVVKASYEGTVESIKNDDGYKTVYSNLLTSEFVVEGERVTTGQTIGTVGNTATFEVADESHLHFEILKDNVQVDPTIYIKY